MMLVLRPLGAMVVRGCGSLLGRVGGVRSFSAIRGGSGPVRYNPQGPGAAKPARRERGEEGRVSHSRPLQRWRRAPKADEEWGLREMQAERREDEVLRGEGDESFASAEMQRLKAEMKLRDSSAPIPRRGERIPRVAEEEEEVRNKTELLRAREAAPVDLDSTQNRSFGEGLFYGDGRSFEDLNSAASNREAQSLKVKTPLHGASGLFFGDGRKFEGVLPSATDLFDDPFSATKDKLFATADTEEDVAVVREKQAAKNYALRLLARAPQTAHMLRQKLSGRNRLESSIESTIVDLQRCGLQSDLEYAEAFARSRWRSSLWGPQRLKQELRRRGVCGEDIEAALEKVFSGTDGLQEEEDLGDGGGRWGMTREASEHLWEKAKLQWGRGGSISAEARKRRMVGWLQRRGFNWSITSQILKSLESQERESG